jgi:retron-type reverse transcriptase
LRRVSRAANEDKVAKRSIGLVLESIYEQEFLSCSLGFQPGRSAHQDLSALRSAFMDRQWLRCCWMSTSNNMISSRLASYPKTKTEILNIQGLTGQWNEERFRSRLGAKA